ncbi:uncharacterized protein LOC118430690 [Branchiostoma floridae]|uniref:Uncharacterized protein LOC118430690 n=1 Tax=Branchiostoma floridae TaxID=7739 RepID=A0A9J7NCA4_BRAFL|nr:uncharacterized protein LOC118430690 [Branchiostoma floridae]XP_035697577.1 uncharacterized protein LOC118430690 [Branchiostoma floridae]
MAIDTAISIPRVQNCCCCCSLKCGVIALSVVFMVPTLLNLVLSLFISTTTDVSISRLLSPSVFGYYGEIIGIGDSICDVVLIILCVILLVGAIKGKYLLCRIWIIGTIVFVTIMFICAIVGSSYHGMNNPETAHELGFLWASIAFEEGLLIYGVILVNSFAEGLRETEASLPAYGQVEEPPEPI